MKKWQRRQRVREIHELAKNAIETGTSDFRFIKVTNELMELKKRKPSIQWLEAMVMLCVAVRQRSGRTVSQVRKLRRLHEAKGTTEAFEVFTKLIEDNLAPFRLSRHGYLLSFKDIDHDEIWSHVGNILGELEDMNLKVFLNSGTLLGVVRDKKLLDHDDDVDLAVLLEATSPKDAAVKWQELGQQLQDKGLLDKKTSTDPAVFKLRSKDSVKVDLFPMWIEDQKVYIYPHTFGELGTDDVFPLQDCALTGYKIPGDPAKMLAQNYGKGWETPDPLFKFFWQPQKKKFSGFLDNIPT